MERDEKEAISFLAPPSPSIREAALPFWGFLFMTEGASCKLGVIKPPDTGDMAPGYCSFLETAELEKFGQEML